MSNQYNKQYDLYKSNSNLVLSVDHRTRGAIGPSSDAQSLATRRSATELLKEMGSRVTHSVSEAEKKAAKVTGKRKRDESSQSTKTSTGPTLSSLFSQQSSNHVPAAGQIALYEPQTRETRLVYETLLSFLSGILPNAGHDVLVSAADELLVVMKDDHLTPNEQRSEIESLLALKLSDDRFRQLINISRKITDFTPEQPVDESTSSNPINQSELAMGVELNDDSSEDEDDNALLPEVAELDDDEDDDSLERQALKGESALHSSENDQSINQHGDHDDNLFKEPVKQTNNKSISFDPRSIDAHWLQRQISKFVPDAVQSQEIASSVFNIMSNNVLADGAVEMQLVEILGYEQFSLIKQCIKHRSTIVYAIRLARASNQQQRLEIENEMRSDDRAKEAVTLLLNDSNNQTDSMDQVDSRDTKRLKVDKTDNEENQSNASNGDAYWLHKSRAVLDLDSLKLSGGGHFMSNAECELPRGSEMFTKKTCVEVHVPAAKPQPFDENEELVRIDSLPAWSQHAFKGMTSLNRIQSRVYQAAMNTANNMLICAPTGAGKTNVAMLTMLQQIGLYRMDEEEAARSRQNDSIPESVKCPLELDSFKIVYIAPMKSLVGEMVINFSSRLAPYGITVKELSGDAQLSADQLNTTQVIVTTPEKWDVVTRKSIERTYINAVKLIIIDEVHLLHDSRGPVLESIIARTLRRIEEEQVHCRLVGLSATLPNYDDVALFLRVDPEKGLFSFDASFRPVPLHSQYIGVTVKKAFKRMQAMNDICYEKVMSHAGKRQMLVFVHSRKDTAVTAKYLKDQADTNGELSKFLSDSSAHAGRAELLRVESESVSNPQLRTLLPFGLAIHHAGMTRKDRNLVEELFADGHISVLVCTATLAWGVNLPASVVLIKGTAIYSPELGDWTELSHLDVMQMFGRAGRPQYDSSGEGIILTQHSQLQYYLSLLNQQLPIESQLISVLPDVLNAEIALGSITSVKEAVDWLGYTYLFVRMLRRPSVYGIDPSVLDSDPSLEQRRLDLIHTAALTLDKHGLIRYDKKGGSLLSLDAGRVASNFYLSYKSVATFNQHLSPSMSDIDCFRVFSLSNEFATMSVREEEKLELASLIDQVPIPIKETIDSSSCKINVLLQAFISRLSLEGFAILADMVYVTQSAGRIIRALFTLTLRKGWSNVALKFLTVAQEIEHRCWAAQSPLRQFPTLPSDAVKRIEGRDLTWRALCDLDAAALGDLVRHAKLGNTLYKAIHAVPNIELTGHVQPITRSLLKLEVTLTADFAWNDLIHGGSQLFWLIVENEDQSKILAYEMFILRKSRVNVEHVVTLLVPVFEPLSPVYFIRCINDRFMSSSSQLALSFKRLILPTRFNPPTELLDMQPIVPANSINPHPLNQAFLRCLSDQGITRFNGIQTQTFASLYRHVEPNVWISAPSGSGKRLMGELAVLSMREHHPNGKCVWMTPSDAFAECLMVRLNATLGQCGLTIGVLTGDALQDSPILESNELIVCTPRTFDVFSRKWRLKNSIINKSLRLFVMDHCEMVGTVDHGPMLELVASRMRFVQLQLAESGLPHFRTVALSRPIANARDLGQWIGAQSSNLFAFANTARPRPMEITLTAIDAHEFHTRQAAMLKPAFKQIENIHRTSKFESSNQTQIIAFACDPKQVKHIAAAWYGFALARGVSFKNNSSMVDSDDNAPDGVLSSLMQLGIGWLFYGQSPVEAALVLQAYRSNDIGLLLADHSVAWSHASLLEADAVVLMDTQAYSSSLQSFAELPVSTLQQLLSFARSRSVIYVESTHKDRVKRLLSSELPVESQFAYVLPSGVIGEVAMPVARAPQPDTRRITNVQDAMDWLTWTLMYRRLTLNCNYYNLTGSSEEHVRDYCSELIESTLDSLGEARMIKVDPFDEGGAIHALHLGQIAANFDVDHATIEMFAQTLTGRSRVKNILDALAASAELELLPVREQDEITIAQLARHCKYAVTASADAQSPADYNDGHVKAHVLLQCYFSRRRLPPALAADLQIAVLPALPKLCATAAYVLGSLAHLKPALSVMQLSQQVMQAQWISDSPLLQIPFLTQQVIDALDQRGVSTVPDLANMLSEMSEDESAGLTAICELLHVDADELGEVAAVTNAFPDMECTYAVLVNGEQHDQDEPLVLSPSDQVTLAVTFTDQQHEVDQGADLPLPVISTRFYPKSRTQHWWVAVGEHKTNQLMAIKQLAIVKQAKTYALDTPIDFTDKQPGQTAELNLYIVNDAWIGADQQFSIQYTVGQATQETEDDTEQMEQDA